MEKQTDRNQESSIDQSKLPFDTSPYTQYKDLEDYKQKGYGTHGHQEVKPGRGAASSTDAPTLSGGGSAQAQLSATDNINRQGVP